MNFWKSISGQVQLELTSAKLERTLLLLNAEGIELFELRKADPLTGEFWIFRKDLKRVQQLCGYLDDKIEIIRKKGIYWQVLQLRKRPVLVMGLILAMVLSWYLPSRIFFVQVEGNTQIPAKQILEAAEGCGIRFGASREQVRSEKVKNALLWKIPQLQWAGVNTSGCVATISVRERAQQPEQPDTEGVSSLAASRDGYVLQATATRGSLLVQPGQAVKEGQLLISGYTDCGIILRAERAEGEVTAQTTRQLTLQTPVRWVSQRENGEKKRVISILLGKKRIILWKDSGICGGSCGRMYEEYYITLPGGFRLPAAVCVETFLEYDQQAYEILPEEQEDRLTRSAQDYLLQQMAAGSILHTDTDLFVSGECIYLRTDFICQEVISRVRIQQIGEANGENN